MWTLGRNLGAFKLCDKRGQLGHLQRELVAPLWLLAKQLSNSKWYANLPSYTRFLYINGALAREARSGAPWVKKCGKLPIRENLVIT